MDGEFVIIEEQAEIVRLIFIAYKEGKSLLKIADELTEMEIVKNDGTSKWPPNIIRYILKNVRYKCDALLQQTYTTEFPFKSVPNRGERDKYYIKNANPRIVSAELFDKVNRLLKQQARHYASNQSIPPQKIWVKKHDILCRVRMCVSTKTR